MLETTKDTTARCSHSRLRRGLITATTAAAMMIGIVAMPQAAEAATSVADRPVGSVAFKLSGRQLTFTGWAYDPNEKITSINMAYYLNGRVKERQTAKRPSPAALKAKGITGNHGFARTWTLPYGKSITCVKALNIRAGTVSPTLKCYTVTLKSTNMRIAENAKTYPGRYAYASGGASPSTGFDCSGLTSYVYSRFNKRIPRTAGAQYSAFKRIAKASAQPGDLIFFHGGGGIYHVGIYMGGTMMVAAASYGQGIKYQSYSWEPNVSFGTITH